MAGLTPAGPDGSGTVTAGIDAGRPAIGDGAEIRSDQGSFGMAERGWKQFERRIARDHGVERQPITGERDASDAMEHAMFCFQMKLRKAIPKCIREWSDSIHRAAQKVDKVGVLIVKEPGKHDDNALVIVRYRDWVALHGTPRPDEGTV